MNATWSVPEKPGLEGLEDKWCQVWRDKGTYAFVRPESREQVFAIDTPPPTVSGSLHVGHVFSYTHTDLIARYQRMSGKRVFYPMGWDDNGLPTERRVQNYFGVRCDPSIPYDPDFTAPEKPEKRQIPVSRRNFIELCQQLTAIDEQVFEDLWRHLGLSVDWDTLYATISPEAQTVAQRAFLHNLARGEAYLSYAPTLWDITFQTAVAQAELEDREYPGFYHRVAFHAPDGAPIYIETTRPELIVSVCALIAHPDDERYQAMFGQTVTDPLFGIEIPVLAHKSAEPDKGAGIAMCCTFGDLTDVTWWRELGLPTRTVIGRDGRLQSETPEWVTKPDAFEPIAGLTTYSAREAVVAMLRASGNLDGEPKPTTRMANFYEKGDKPLEIVATRQWYISNGGKDLNLRGELLRRGSEQLDWTPDYMRNRFTNWVEGLNGDWLISRQRFFGVPFPVWYPLDDAGEPDWDHPILAPEDALPIDPMSTPPPGFTAEQRDQPNGFTADKDVMDTWATSSLTPQIACGWGVDDELFNLTFPMDMAPQAHDIIRTWLFTRVVRSHLEFDSLPWKRATISGFVVDPDRKKMSKSKGNVVVPTEILTKFGSDAVRWRAAMARPGADSPFDETQMKVGRRLAVKLLNASKFVLGMGSQMPLSAVTEPVDLALLETLKGVIVAATASFEAFDYTSALEVTEAFFWSFCDDTIELLKERAYGNTPPSGAEGGSDADAETQGTATVADTTVCQGEVSPAAASARAALQTTLNVLQRLFAPYLPFVTEEVWSWWQDGSIHTADWPTVAELELDGDVALLSAVSEALIGIRGAKSNAKVSQKTKIRRAEFVADADVLELLKLAEADLRAVGSISGEIIWTPKSGPMSVACELLMPQE